MPRVLAASTMSVPAGTVTLWPSIDNSTLGTCRDLSDVAFMTQGVVLVLAAEVAEGGVDDPAGRVAQPAQAAAVLEPVGNALQVVELDLRALVGEDPLVHADRPVAADPARRALPARLVGVELQQPVRGTDDAVAVVHDDHATRSTHRARGGERLHVSGRVEHRFRQHGSRRTAGPEDLQLATLG